MKRVIKLADGAQVEVTDKEGLTVLSVTDATGGSAVVAMEGDPSRDVALAILSSPARVQASALATAVRASRKRGRR